MTDYPSHPLFQPAAYSFDRTLEIIHILESDGCPPEGVKAACLSGLTLDDCKQIRRALRSFVYDYLYRCYAAGRPLPEKIDWRDIGDTMYQRHLEEVKMSQFQNFMGIVERLDGHHELSPVQREFCDRMLRRKDRYPDLCHVVPDFDRRQELGDEIALCEEYKDVTHNVVDPIIRERFATYEQMKTEAFFRPLMAHFKGSWSDNGIRERIKKDCKALEHLR